MACPPKTSCPSARLPGLPMLLRDFDYALPPELIAQEPALARDEARLLTLDRATGRIAHRHVSDLPEHLGPGDVLVVNDTRVIPARLFGVAESGRSVEVLLIRQAGEQLWDALVKPARTARIGQRLTLAGGHLTVEVVRLGTFGRRRLRLPPAVDLRAILDAYGIMPLPPYIKRSPGPPAPGAEEGLEHADGSGRGARHSALGTDRDRYQTVYAEVDGAVAAPTAGLHFTHGLLDRLRSRGVLVRRLTLHVGPGTFQPIRTEEISRHQMEAEWYQIPEQTAGAVRAAQAEGRRVVVVGTTSMRALEHAAQAGEVRAGSSEADVFIVPGFHFRVAGAFLTNFHLPRSTPLLLVSAFAGREAVQRAYAEAIARRYRFYSYGDAMLVL